MHCMQAVIVRSFAVLFLVVLASAQDAHAKVWIREHYSKREVMVPMRDGVKLFTSVYTPKDTPGASAKHPILLRRTPYSCSPYGEDQFPSEIGPSALFTDKGY